MYGELPASSPVQINLFLASVTVDFMNICHAFGDSLLHPLVHLVFVLIEPVAALM